MYITIWRKEKQHTPRPRYANGHISQFLFVTLYHILNTFSTLAMTKFRKNKHTTILSMGNNLICVLLNNVFGNLIRSHEIMLGIQLKLS